ncbi:MAG TPA: hypothetical protein ENO22_06350 [candidate division Zixibacteria bacterium]|nr:hypothetical protein [candidate division Zixibacteria bacterium]
MRTFSYKGKTYKVDQSGFLENYDEWDDVFAEGIAQSLGIDGGLTGRHWEVIKFIRKNFEETGQCPLLYQTCRKK